MLLLFVYIGALSWRLTDIPAEAGTSSSSFSHAYPTNQVPQPTVVVPARVDAVTITGSGVVAREPVTAPIAPPADVVMPTGEAADEVTSGKRRSTRLSSKPAVETISHKKQRKK